jgi:nucleoid-associated protein YgaU
MIATSVGRIVLPSLALVAASGAALVFGIAHVWREPPVETTAPIATPTVLPPPPAAQSAAASETTAQAVANAAAGAPAVSPGSPATDESLPAFDIARIDRTGDAVIAGRAAPGATVELLRNGERHDLAVADQSGQFVMTPPRLPPGDYELTLRSRQPDGTQAISKQSVAVALTEIESGAGADRSRAKVPVNAPETHATAATPAAATPADAGSPPAAVAPRIATKVVTRGDSLWRISRITYGVGTRYAVVYRANRDRIRDPNRIYPGQIFVLPMKGR